MIKNKRIKKNWSQQDVLILVWVVSKYCQRYQIFDAEGEIDDEDWKRISKLIPGSSPQTCKFKYLNMRKVNLSVKQWTQEESNYLFRLVKDKQCAGKGKDGINWKLISQRLYNQVSGKIKVFRCAKQCREHWNSYLNPNLKKGAWIPQEDIELLTYIRNNNGTKKWSDIVRNFRGRTQNALKNRYTLLMQKMKKNNKYKDQIQLINDYLDQNYVNQFTAEDSIPIYYSEERTQRYQAQRDLNRSEQFQTKDGLYQIEEKIQKISLKQPQQIKVKNIGNLIEQFCSRPRGQIKLSLGVYVNGKFQPVKAGSNNGDFVVQTLKNVSSKSIN